MDRLTAEELHTAADEVGEMTEWPLGAEVAEFMRGSDWDHPMDHVALALGIALGIQAMLNRQTTAATPGPTPEPEPSAS